MIKITIRLDYPTFDKLLDSWIWLKLVSVIDHYKCLEWGYEEVSDNVH